MHNIIDLSKAGQWDTTKHEATSERSTSPRNDSISISIFEALSQFILYMRDEKQASPLTLDAYERDLLRFATGLEASDPDNHGEEPQLVGVTSEDVRAHMRLLIDRGLAKATVRRALYAVASFFRWAQRWQLVTNNPVDRVTIPRRERVREVRALSKRERALLCTAADTLVRESPRPLDVQASLLVRLMLKVGLRRGEVIGLSWRDVLIDQCNEQQHEIIVRRGKGGKSRCVPLDDEDLLKELREVRERRGVGQGADYETPLARVLVSTRGTRLSETSFHKIFHRVLATAELDGRGITPHSLRHTFGSVLCARGVPVPYVKDLLGHEDIGSTMVYVHSTPAALRAAVRKLRE